MKKQTLFGILLCISVVALVLLFVETNALEYKTLKSVTETRINFDSHAGGGNSASQPRAFNESRKAPLKRISIQMSFFVYSIGEHNNIFQTAPVNGGLRLELTKPGTLAVIAGARNTRKFLPYVLTTNLALKEWHTLAIDIDPENHVVILLDGDRMDATDPALAYDISNIIFGAGFSATRPFDGQIKDASISYQYVEHRYSGGTITALRAVFLVAALICLVLFSGLDRRAVAIYKEILADEDDGVVGDLPEANGAGEKAAGVVPPRTERDASRRGFGNDEAW